MNDTHPRRRCDARQNRLLGALPYDEWMRWQPHLEPIDLVPGQVLCEAESAPMYAHFPTSAVASLVNLSQEGGSTEIAVVGNEGMVGISIFMGGNAMNSRAVVQSAGEGYRVRAQSMKNELSRAGTALATLLRYTLEMIGQVAQSAVCNRYHSVEQQLCRRLLVGLDRGSGDELELTHDQAADLLGVRRETITSAAGKLQRAGLIQYARGHIRVLNRRGLEARTCDCYSAPNAKRQPLFSKLAAA